jgi:hypothetical protein
MAIETGDWLSYPAEDLDYQHFFDGPGRNASFCFCTG